MVSKQTVGEVLAVMGSLFNRAIDESLIKAYHSFFDEIDSDDLLKKASREYVKNEKFFPTVSDFYKYIKIVQPNYFINRKMRLKKEKEYQLAETAKRLLEVPIENTKRLN